MKNIKVAIIGGGNMGGTLASSQEEPYPKKAGPQKGGRPQKEMKKLLLVIEQ